MAVLQDVTRCGFSPPRVIISYKSVMFDNKRMQMQRQEGEEQMFLLFNNPKSKNQRDKKAANCRIQETEMHKWRTNSKVMGRKNPGHKDKNAGDTRQNQRKKQSESTEA